MLSTIVESSIFCEWRTLANGIRSDSFSQFFHWIQRRRRREPGVDWISKLHVIMIFGRYWATHAAVRLLLIRSLLLKSALVWIEFTCCFWSFATHAAHCIALHATQNRHMQKIHFPPSNTHIHQFSLRFVFAAVLAFVSICSTENPILMNFRYFSHSKSNVKISITYICHTQLSPHNGSDSFLLPSVHNFCCVWQVVRLHLSSIEFAGISKLR